VVIGNEEYQNGKLSSLATRLYNLIVSQDALKMALPSLLYAVQNNLLYYALSNLDAAPYQVIYQLKVFTTAIFSVVILNKRLSMTKWGALVMLFIGFVMVQLAISHPSSAKKEHTRPYVALGAVLVSCITSGFAGVYFEWVLKGTTPTLWERNIQLGTFGILFSSLITAVRDYAYIHEHGFFAGYDSLVVLVVIIQAAGGLIIATVVKYADNILKGFALAISIVLSSLISIYFFNFSLTMQFVFGSVMVVGAVVLYSQPDLVKKNKSEHDSQV
jgi:UDP-sugar transporter A1/2/3